jgi:hypothetical protein
MALPSGMKLDLFEILSPLGHGGIGEVTDALNIVMNWDAEPKRK